jgi:hypothetical protein
MYNTKHIMTMKFQDQVRCEKKDWADSLLDSLPRDMVHHILSYSDTIKCRNGKYMNQISKKDKRYEMLLTIRPITKHNLCENVYQTYCRSVCATLTVEFVQDEIIYAFCYDFKENPDTYHLWIRQ